MRSARLAKATLRTAFAVVFGFMSLLHGPITAFANPIPADHGMSAAGHAISHHHAGHADQSTPAIPDAAPSCYGVGCFVVLESFAAGVPEASRIALETLSPSVTKEMVPAPLDPVVPPPRNQV